jgi:hypothetical protein
MRIATLLSGPLVAAAFALPLAAPALADIAISVDKNAQQMTVAVDGQQKYVWPVSTGRAGYDTPNGSFKVNRMDADHFSQEWDNAPMPHTMFFDLHGHAIHGFFDEKHLGLAVSHGCVRLSRANATVLFDLVKTEGMANTSVTVSGQTPGGGNGPVARAHLPDQETAYSPQGNSQQGYGQQQQGYSQQGYGQQGYAHSRVTRSSSRTASRSSRPRPATVSSSILCAARLRSALLRPAAVLRTAAIYYQQPQPYYGQPAYRQW